MDKLNLMNSFVHIAEKGSYTAAAHHLGKTKALMSTHVSQLESILEVRLIHRSTRGLQLTDAGRAYYEQAKRILDDISMVEIGMKSDQNKLPVAFVLAPQLRLVSACLCHLLLSLPSNILSWRSMWC